MRGWGRALWLAAAATTCAAAATPSQAGALRSCDRQVALSVAQQDKLFRFGAIVKDELDQSGQRLALMSRSGLDLSRFGVRYSHAGVSLRDSANGPWSVRQLYFACDEGRPRLFDQGIAGFLLGTDNPAVGYLSVVLLPPDAAAPLADAALDNRRALQLLGATYSANAYPYGLQYQNCNQWLVELLALAWGRPAADAAAVDDAAATPAQVRAQAQRWLAAQRYQPSLFDLQYRALLWLGAFVPWLHSDDHPFEEIDQKIYRVSMPASIEAFVRQRVPGAARIELCHNERQVVIRHGWGSIPEGCEPGPGDRVVSLIE